MKFVDPANWYFWRVSPRTLKYEETRDSLLFVSKRLDGVENGRSIDLSPDDPKSTCRTVFLKIDRQHLSSFAKDFDFPSPDFTAPRRFSTNVPQKQLFFLNSPFVIEQAKQIARNTETIVDKKERVCRLFQIVLARNPTDDEAVAAMRFIAEQESPTGSEDKAASAEMDAWSRLAHAVLQVNEFVFVE